MEERFTSGANLNFIVFFACESFHLKHTGDYNTGVIKDATYLHLLSLLLQKVFFYKTCQVLGDPRYRYGSILL